jgi:hypothetical protein
MTDYQCIQTKDKVIPELLLKDTYKCSEVANQVSCSAMTELAKAEFYNNMTLLSYNVVYPVCERLQSLADRDMESYLLLTDIQDSKTCFDMSPDYKKGPWIDQFKLYKKEHQFDNQKPYDVRYEERPSYDIRFDQWTRPKVSTKM